MSVLDSMRLASRPDQEHNMKVLDSMRLASRTDQNHKSLYRSNT